MSGSALVFSRPAKLDHLDTVRYEIHMLRHSYSELDKRKLTEESAWIYLESFLLHYRNLIEFLGKKTPGGTDVHITNLWGLVSLPEPAGVAKLHTVGVGLYDRYEPSDKMGGGRISQYLSHCTERTQWVSISVSTAILLAVCGGPRCARARVHFLLDKSRRPTGFYKWRATQPHRLRRFLVSGPTRCTGGSSRRELWHLTFCLSAASRFASGLKRN